MFITFEGGEGSGKTTIIEKLATQLRHEGYDVVTTREPGGSLIAEKIRKLLLDKENTTLTYHTEALLFAAARAQHLDEVILPALQKQQIIICDRYLDSSVAYQAFGRNLGIDFINQINAYAIAHMPTLTIYLQLDPKVGAARVKNGRQHKVDRLDLETENFHQRVAEGYEYLAKTYKNRILTIGANRDVESIYQDVYQSIKQQL